MIFFYSRDPFSAAVKPWTDTDAGHLPFEWEGGFGFEFLDIREADSKNVRGFFRIDGISVKTGINMIFYLIFSKQGLNYVLICVTQF